MLCGIVTGVEVFSVLICSVEFDLNLYAVVSAIYIFNYLLLRMVQSGIYNFKKSHFREKPEL